MKEKITTYFKATERTIIEKFEKLCIGNFENLDETEKLFERHSY